MAQVTECVSSPTLTSVAISTSYSLSRTTTRVVSTAPGPVVTTTVRTCTVINTNTTTCGLFTTLATGTGTVTTNDVVLTVTLDVPVSYQATFYGSSCSAIYRDTTIIPTTSSSHSPSISTLTTSSIVTSDGSTFVTFFTTTSDSIPTTTQDNTTTSSSSSPNIPVIVGGVLGGISALALIALLVWHLFKKKAPFHDDDFLKDTGHDPFQKNTATDPYQYNPVAQQDTQPVGNPFSNSPGAQGLGNNVGQTNQFNGFTGNEGGGQYGTMGHGGNAPMSNEIGMQPGATGNDVMYNAPNQLPVHNLQNPSLAPLLVGGAGAAAAALAARQTRPNTSSSGTSGSDFPGAGGPAMGYNPQQYPSYPPTLAMYAQQQAYGSSQGGHPSIGHALSVGSSTAGSTAYSGASSSNPHKASGMEFVPMATIQTGQYPQQQYVQMPQPQYDSGPYSHTGSSTSANPPINPPLQVRNPEFEMPVQGSSDMHSTPGLAVVGSSSSSQQLDGKGRPLNTKGEKATLVHLDGGAYQESSTPAPPAYMEME